MGEGVGGGVGGKVLAEILAENLAEILAENLVLFCFYITSWMRVLWTGFKNSLMTLTFMSIFFMFRVVCYPLLCRISCILWIYLLSMYLICNIHLLILSIHLRSSHVCWDRRKYQNGNK